MSERRGRNRSAIVNTITKNTTIKESISQKGLIFLGLKPNGENDIF